VTAAASIREEALVQVAADVAKAAKRKSSIGSVGKTFHSSELLRGRGHGISSSKRK
jgi:hypothetical protein